jgi:hypothetical protein
MSERTIRLDIGAQANARADSHAAQSGNGGLDEQPEEENVDRFRRALTAGNEDSTSSSGSRQSDDAELSGEARGQDRPRRSDATQVSHARGVFGLFGGLNPVASVADDSSLPSDSAFGSAADLANEVADRIMVSADEGREARIFIRDDVMPGVEVRIAQEQGRWVVTFSIGDAFSFKVLEKAGQGIAEELAGRLSSSIEVNLVDASDPSGVPAHTFFAEPTRNEGAAS